MVDDFEWTRIKIDEYDTKSKLTRFNIVVR